MCHAHTKRRHKLGGLVDNGTRVCPLAPLALGLVAGGRRRAKQALLHQRMLFRSAAAVATALGALSALLPMSSAFSSWTVLPRLRQRSRVAMAVHVYEPAFKPAYGFDKASPLGPTAETGEVVPGMRIWLQHMGLEEYLQEANGWCSEMGAAVMGEVLEGLSELAEVMPAEAGERIRKRGRVAYSTLLQRGELLEQEAVVTQEEDYAFAGRIVLSATRSKKKEAESSSKEAEVSADGASA